MMEAGSVLLMRFEHSNIPSSSLASLLHRLDFPSLALGAKELLQYGSDECARDLLPVGDEFRQALLNPVKDPTPFHPWGLADTGLKFAIVAKPLHGYLLALGD